MIIPYLSAGNRFYGDKPTPVMSRSCYEFQVILSGLAVPCPLPAHTVPRDRPRLYISDPASAYGWTDDPGCESHIRVLHSVSVPQPLADLMQEQSIMQIPLTDAHVRTVAFVWDYLSPHYRRPSPTSSLALQACLLLLTEMAMPATNESVSLDQQDYHREKSRQAWHYFRQHLAQFPTVEQVATAIGLSAPHFRRIFHSAEGCSPHTAFQRDRMQLAARFLREGQSVTAVAHALGYSETSAFSRAYLAHHGHTPSRATCAVSKTINR